MSILRIGLIPVLLLSGSTASAESKIRPDFEMDRDPEIYVPVRVLSERQKALWQEALARPEADMQRMAADAIARAHAAGFPEMTTLVSPISRRPRVVC